MDNDGYRLKNLSWPKLYTLKQKHRDTRRRDCWNQRQEKILKSRINLFEWHRSEIPATWEDEIERWWVQGHFVLQSWVWGQPGKLMKLFHFLKRKKMAENILVEWLLSMCEPLSSIPVMKTKSSKEKFIWKCWWLISHTNNGKQTSHHFQIHSPPPKYPWTMSEISKHSKY